MGGEFTNQPKWDPKTVLTGHRTKAASSRLQGTAAKRLEDLVDDELQQVLVLPVGEVAVDGAEHLVHALKGTYLTDHKFALAKSSSNCTCIVACKKTEYMLLGLQSIIHSINCHSWLPSGFFLAGKIGEEEKKRQKTAWPQQIPGAPRKSWMGPAGFLLLFSAAPGACARKAHGASEISSVGTTKTSSKGACHT